MIGLVVEVLLLGKKNSFVFRVVGLLMNTSLITGLARRARLKPCAVVVSHMERSEMCNK